MNIQGTLANLCRINNGAGNHYFYNINAETLPSGTPNVVQHAVTQQGYDALVNGLQPYCINAEFSTDYDFLEFDSEAQAADEVTAVAVLSELLNLIANDRYLIGIIAGTEPARLAIPVEMVHI